MVFEEKDKKELKFAMINKFGKTSYKNLSEELGVSRTAVYDAINNDSSMDSLRNKIKQWIKDNTK